MAKIEDKILGLKGEFLLEDIAEKIGISQKSVLSYLSRLEKVGKIKTGITEDMPYEKAYRI